MKRIFFVIPALCLALVFGCDSDRRTADGDGYQDSGRLNEVEDAETIGEKIQEEDAYDVEVERTAAGGVGEETQEFFTHTLSSSMLEIQMAQLALVAAESQEIKDYAQMIASEHEQANEELRVIAEQEDFNLPATMMEDQEEKLDELQEATDEGFDRKYISSQIDMHQQSIERFERMQQNVENQELSQWIDNTLPILRQHLEQAQQIQEQLGADEQPM